VLLQAMQLPRPRITRSRKEPNSSMRHKDGSRYLVKYWAYSVFLSGQIGADTKEVE
jgi:hypothetical protein